MFRVRIKTGQKISILLLATGLIALLSACSASGSTTLPQISSTIKSYPKLDSQLTQLVNADRNGDAAEFARSQNISLNGNSIRVIIEVLPGQIETVSQAVISLGGKVETSNNNLLQALVPVSSLTKLAESSDIRLIRLPMQALPGS
jgi:hypothetical protein